MKLSYTVTELTMQGDRVITTATGDLHHCLIETYLASSICQTAGKNSPYELSIACSEQVAIQECQKIVRAFNAGLIKRDFPRNKWLYSPPVPTATATATAKVNEDDMDVLLGKAYEDDMDVLLGKAYDMISKIAGAQIRVKEKEKDYNVLQKIAQDGGLNRGLGDPPNRGSDNLRPTGCSDNLMPKDDWRVNLMPKDDWIKTEKKQVTDYVDMLEAILREYRKRL